MRTQWQDFSAMNAKWERAWLSGLGAGVFDQGSVLDPKPRRPVRGLGALSFSQIQTLQDLINIENEFRKRPPIAVTGTFNQETCLTVLFYVDLLVNQGEKVDPFLYDFLFNNEQEIAQACTALAESASSPAPPPPPAPSPAPPPPAPSPTQPTGPAPPELMQGSTSCYIEPDGYEWCDCYVEEGSSGPHIEDYQKALNQALDKAGYEAIPVTGAWDAETCGAVFELRGSFRYDPPKYCVTDFVFPIECEDMVFPRKKGARTAAFAIGGLVVAAGIGGAYWLMRR